MIGFLLVIDNIVIGLIHRHDDIITLLIPLYSCKLVVKLSSVASLLELLSLVSVAI